MGLGRIVFINKTQAISVTLRFSSQKHLFKPFFLQMIGKQGQQRELCAHSCLLCGQGAGKEHEPVHSNQTCDSSVNPGGSLSAWHGAYLEYVGLFRGVLLLWAFCFFGLFFSLLPLPQPLYWLFFVWCVVFFEGRIWLLLDLESSHVPAERGGRAGVLCFLCSTSNCCTAGSC